MGVMKPELVMKSIIPVVMAGVLGIYGLIIAVIIANGGLIQFSLAAPLLWFPNIAMHLLLISTRISLGAVSPPLSNGTIQYSAFTGFAHLAAGLACGLSGMAAGIAIGIVGDAGVRASAQQAKLYVGMVLILIFAEALGLYGLIVGLILTSKESKCPA